MSAKCRAQGRVPGSRNELGKVLSLLCLRDQRRTEAGSAGREEPGTQEDVARRASQVV